MLALEGMLVIAIEQAVAAPLCTARLLSAGARVIKIERNDGDFARGYDQAAKGESAYFTWLNQGKESVCLDFKTLEGASLLRKLLAKADILVQNLAPGALARAGFSSQEMHDINPNLVICNISGYGCDSQLANKRAYDLLIQAESGLISVSGTHDAPGRIGVSLCDIGTGVTAYGAVLEALLARQATGAGQEVSTSLFDVAAEWMSVPHVHAHYGEGEPKPSGLQHPSIAPYGAFTCSDQRLVLISIQNEREWLRLCKQVLLCPQLTSCPQYSNNNSRVRHREQLDRDINAITASLSSHEFQKRLEAAGIASGIINGACDLMSHRAFKPQTMYTAYGEAVNLPAHPVNRVSCFPVPEPQKTSRTPLLGEHTEHVFSEFREVVS